jgi:ADP-heptose:LPS heptosyltransferase
VAACAGGSLLALQKGPGAEQRQACSFADRFVACQDAVDRAWDFLDAVALIALCDLVITSDSCVAHLAGAMGHPTWLLLASVPDWRWGLEGEQSGWYSSLRLFRQRQAGDWHELMQRVEATLPAYLAKDRQGAAAKEH